MSSKRKSELSLLNVLFCLLVIFIHVISYAVAAFLPGTAEYNLVMIPWRLVSFVVQGFIFLAGVKFFLTDKDKVPFLKYMKGRILGVIFPYAISFVVYYYGINVLVHGWPPFYIAYIMRYFLLGDLVCHFYFIPLLFQLDVLQPLWKWIVNKCSWKIVLPISFIISAWLPTLMMVELSKYNFVYTDRVFTTYIAYWLLGCYIGKNYDRFVSLMKKYFVAISSVFAVVLGFFVYFSYVHFNGIVNVPFISTVDFIYMVCTLIFLFALAIRIPENAVERLPLVKSIDKSSYHIYLWPMLVLIIVDLFLEHFGIASQGVEFIIRAVFTYGVTITLCVLYSRLKRKLFKCK